LTFQIFTDLSPLPLAKDAPPGLQATDATLRFDEMSQQAKQLDKKRKLDKKKKKSQGSECPVRVDQKKRILEKNRNRVVQKKKLPVCVPAHRACGIGLLKTTQPMELARANRVVLAGKLLK
jgi:hypothetical protein